MTMIKGYDSNSKREYTAPEAPSIVEPEPMIHKIPKWVKGPVLYLALAYLAVNFGGFIAASGYRGEGMSKSEIEEKIDKDYGDKGRLVKFVLDDLSKPGRKLVYLMSGDGEKNKKNENTKHN